MSKHQKGDSLRERHSISEIGKIANYTEDANVKIEAIRSIKELTLAGTSNNLDTVEKPRRYARIVEPVLLGIIASFLWEKVIKKAAAWIAATFLSANMVHVIPDLHVAVTTLLL